MNSARAHYKARPASEKPILYRCKDYAPSQNVAGTVCYKTAYKEQDIRIAVRRFFLKLVESPEFVAAAYSAYLQEEKTGYSQEQHMAVIAEMRELDKRETATA